MHSDRQDELRQTLTKFQVRELAVLADVGPTHGLAIKADLEQFYGTDINHGRLYPNLDELHDLGLVEKHEYAVDDRTHSFELTEAGWDFLDATILWLDRRIDGAHPRGETEDQEVLADGGQVIDGTEQRFEDELGWDDLPADQRFAQLAEWAEADARDLPADPALRTRIEIAVDQLEAVAERAEMLRSARERASEMDSPARIGEVVSDG